MHTSPQRRRYAAKRAYGRADTDKIISRSSTANLSSFGAL